MYHARILGTGSFLPQKKIDNRDLYGMIKGFDAQKGRESFKKREIDVTGLSDAEVFDRWVQQVSGIKVRHFFTDVDIKPHPRYTPKKRVELMGSYAAEAAIQKAGIAKEEIDSVIFATLTSDTMCPNPAVVLSDFMGLGEPGAITTNTACSGFIDALGLAMMQVQTGIYKTVLIVTSEQFQDFLNMNDPTTAILFGDGASACVVSRSEEPGILSYWSGSRYSENIILNMGEKLQMGGGPLVQRSAVNAMHLAATKALERAGLTMADIDYVLPHQANVRILIELAKKLEIPENKMFFTIDRTANISCATIPVTLDWFCRGQMPGQAYKKGMTILSTAVGGGYVFSGSVFKI